MCSDSVPAGFASSTVQSPMQCESNWSALEGKSLDHHGGAVGITNVGNIESDEKMGVNGCENIGGSVMISPDFVSLLC